MAEGNTEVEVITPTKPPEKPAETPKDKPVVIDVHPGTGQIRNITTTLEQFTNMDDAAAQAEQVRLQQETEAWQTRLFQEAQERKNDQNAAFSEGEDEGKKLSELVNTAEGRGRIENYFNNVIKANKGLFGSKQKMQNTLIGIVDEGIVFRHDEIHKEMQDWEKKHQKLPYGQLVQENYKHKREVGELLGNLRLARKYIIGGEIEKYTSRHSNNVKAIQETYRNAFEDSWKEVEAKGNLSDKESPWYLKQNVKNNYQ